MIKVSIKEVQEVFKISRPDAIEAAIYIFERKPKALIHWMNRNEIKMQPPTMDQWVRMNSYLSKNLQIRVKREGGLWVIINKD